MSKNPIDGLGCNWDKFCKKWSGNPALGGFQKYIDRSAWCLEVAEKRIKMIESLVDADGHNLSILDISTGFGFFPCMCMKFGHSVTITDPKRDDMPFLDEARESLGLPKCINHLYPDGKYAPLPSDIGMFDVITAFHVAPQGLWERDDWVKYIGNAIGHLKKEGVLMLRPNDSKGYDSLNSLINGFIPFIFLGGRMEDGELLVKRGALTRSLEEA